jgi:hypothetical protein
MLLQEESLEEEKLRQGKAILKKRVLQAFLHAFARAPRGARAKALAGYNSIQDAVMSKLDDLEISDQAKLDVLRAATAELGNGGVGVCYRSTYQGKACAVKVSPPLSNMCLPGHWPDMLCKQH